MLASGEVRKGKQSKVTRTPVLTHLERQKKKEYYCQLFQQCYQTVDGAFLMLLISAEV